MSKRSVPAVLDRIRDVGLIEEGDTDSFYSVPFRELEWIASLEAQLGTDALARRAAREIESHWHTNERLRRPRALRLDPFASLWQTSRRYFPQAVEVRGKKRG